MRVTVVGDLCEGFGICADHAPELFDMDEWGYASEHGDGDVPAGAEDLARRAVADCPLHAIRIAQE